MSEASDQNPDAYGPAPVRIVPLTRPLDWLARGWIDFIRAPLPSALHGLAVVVGGYAILLFTLRYWYLLPGALSGFLLVGPILATGLYELSRRMALGDTPSLQQVVDAWRRGTQPLVWLGLLLTIAGTMWVLVSAVVFALYAKSPTVDWLSLLKAIILNKESWLFEVWLLLGGLGAALVFAATAVSAPMLLDRDVDMITALATSIRAVGENPVAMAFWAAIIMGLTALSMATLMIGFLVVVPLVGHATWHAYRDLVDADALPPRI